jgi:hypothetical protein
MILHIAKLKHSFSPCITTRVQWDTIIIKHITYHIVQCMNNLKYPDSKKVGYIESERRYWNCHSYNDFINKYNCRNNSDVVHIKIDSKYVLRLIILDWCTCLCHWILYFHFICISCSKNVWFVNEIQIVNN